MSIFAELECAVGDPLSDKGDRRSEPGSGGDGSSMQDGGTRGLRKPSHRSAISIWTEMFKDIGAITVVLACWLSGYPCVVHPRSTSA